MVQKIFDFISDFLPFSLLPEKEVWHIARNVSVKYLPKNTFLSLGDDLPLDQFYMVNDGTIEVSSRAEDTNHTIGPGSIFGIHTLGGLNDISLDVRSTEEAILYCVQSALLLSYKDDYPNMASFFVSVVIHPNELPQSKNSLGFKKNTENPFTIINPIDGRKNAIVSHSDASVGKVAQLMADHEVGSVIIVDPSMKPIGIITDKDLRNKVVVNRVSRSENVANLMSSPVVCAKPMSMLSSMQLLMGKFKISHVVITKDGTPDTEVIGLISEHDLARQSANSPFIIVEKIKNANLIDDLILCKENIDDLIAQYLKNGMPAWHISSLVSDINDELIKKIIGFALLREEGKAMIDIPFSWMLLGSMGRREQIFHTDLDCAMIFKADNRDNLIHRKCVKFAKVIENLLTQTGFELCPANTLASNSTWCRSVDHWKSTVNGWIENTGAEELKNANIFYDFRYVYGDETLVGEVRDYITLSIQKHPLHLYFFAKNVLTSPPATSFFNNFVLEKDGEHAHKFDIKLRAFMPIADVARLMTLYFGSMVVQNTIQRLELLSDFDKKHSATFKMLAGAYEILMKIRAEESMKGGTAGRYIDPSNLDKLTRLQMRNALQSLDELRKYIKWTFRDVNL